MSKLFIEKKIWIFVVCILALIFLFLFTPSLFTGIKNLSIKVILSPVRFCSGAGQYFHSKRDLVKENALLHKRVGDLSLELEQFKELQNENERLRDFLKFKKRIGFNTVPAEIIARNPNDWIGSFVINKGTADGIQKDSAVCSAKGLLGKVVEPRESTSSVMSITHPSFKTGGMLKDTRVNGIVVGSGKGMAKVLYLPIDAEVTKGTIVITSGFSRIFPKGITMGKIVSVGKSKTGLYQYAIIKPSANSFDQEEVLCIR